MSRTMSDWEKLMKSKGGSLEEFANSIHTEKSSDMKRLKHSSLPQFDYIKVPYSRFTKDNKELMDFMSKYSGFCVRALPTLQGIKKGFTRKPLFGFLSFKDCQKFLSGVIKNNTKDYQVGLGEWEPNKYGWVFICKKTEIIGEIGLRLDKLSHGQETPLASFILDKRKNRKKWVVHGNKDAEKALLNALKYVRYRLGYFEGTSTESSQIRFLDFKTNPKYLSQ